MGIEGQTPQCHAPQEIRPQRIINHHDPEVVVPQWEIPMIFVEKERKEHLATWTLFGEMPVLGVSSQLVSG